MRTHRPHGLDAMARNLRHLAPAVGARRVGDLNDGDQFALGGYVLTYHNAEWVTHRPDDDGQVHVRFTVSGGRSGPTYPGMVKFTSGRPGTLQLPWTTGNDFVTDAQLPDLPVRQLWHPLDWHRTIEGFHYPTCCGQLWPCTEAGELLDRWDDAWQQDRERETCENCHQFVYSRGIRFGRGAIERLDPLNPSVPLTSGELKLAEPGAVHGDHFADPAERVVQFCHRSKCVTAAYRFGEANGCPIPVRRKDLKPPIIVDWPVSAVPTQPEPPAGPPKLTIVQAGESA